MNPPRTPVVLGVGPRTGASTVAAALHAHDGGARDLAADVVVCCGTEESLRRADTLAVAGSRPLLAVVLLHTGPAPTPPRLRLAARRYAGVTVLPHVGAWSGLHRPADDIAGLLGRHQDRLPPAHRAYAAALRAVAAALMDTGLLDRPGPPVVALPRTAGRPQPAAPVRLDTRDRPNVNVARTTTKPVSAGLDLDLDDEALEHAVALLGTR